MTFEEQMLRTATLALIAFGAVMVYSASSGTSLLSDGGDCSRVPEALRRLRRARAGRALVLRAHTASSPRSGSRRSCWRSPSAGLLLVMVPGFGIEANGSRRWLGAGPLQFQPSEVAKLALVLYAALLIASAAAARALAARRAPADPDRGRDGVPRSWSSRTSAPRW